MCSIDTNILQEYIDGSLVKSERLLLQEHLNSCANCRRELNQLKILDWDLRHMQIEVPQELEEVRKASLEHYFEHKDATNLGIRQIMTLQRQILAHSTSFIRYIPKSRLVNKAKDKVAEKTSELFKERLTNSILGKLIRI